MTQINNTVISKKIPKKTEKKIPSFKLYDFNVYNEDNLNEEEFDKLYKATIIHEKPLTNALGEDFRNILTKNKVIEIFRRM